MIIVTPTQQPGASGKRGSQFTGDVFPHVSLRTDGVVINTVDFTPGARTFWHRHESGQILIVVAGRGLIQARGGAVNVIRAGDTIWASPGEPHWHGAAPDSYLVHIAISLGVTEWADAVNDAEYVDPEAENAR
jgi:quercetin dioxygenase-like cupin family protein